MPILVPTSSCRLLTENFEICSALVLAEPQLVLVLKIEKTEHDPKITRMSLGRRNQSGEGSEQFCWRIEKIVWVRYPGARGGDVS